MNNEALTITLLTRVIQETLENVFPFVRVIGEISNFKQHSSGHRYFSLKDEGAQIRAIMWRTRSLNVAPYDGMKVIVTGRISLYPSQGNYQIDCFTLVPAGVGDLYLAFEKLKTDLQALGYFDESRKRPLPRFAARIGVATSATGAAVQDILSTLAQRMPSTTVYFRPTLVQGEGSAEDIVAAINDFQRYNCDVIIIGRGGGSIEDLWSFNTRIVADAIFKSATPIISAVGHETDFSIADFVADARAATPTAAAVMCTPIRAEELLYDLDMRTESMREAVEFKLRDCAEQISQWSNGSLERVVTRAIRDHNLRLLEVSRTIFRSTTHRLQMMKSRLDGLENNLRSLEPLSPLKRGFALLKIDNALLDVNIRLQRDQTVKIIRQDQVAEALITVVSNHS